MLTGCPSCRVIVKETVDLGIVSQYAFRLCEIGNGVQDDIVLCGQSGVLRIAPHADGKEREIIHEALEKVTHTSWLSLLSDKGDVFWSDAAFEISFAYLIATCHVREADGEVSLAIMYVMQFLAFPIGEFGVYPSFIQVG